MKAKDYFEKYFAGRSLDDLQEDDRFVRITIDFMNELTAETLALCESRGSRSNAVFDGAMNESNKKFNAVCNLCEKKFGTPILRRNGFRNYWEGRMKEEGIIK